MSVVSLLGCGWLGLPLAKSLLAEGYQVKGSTTHLDKVDTLRQQQIFPFCIHSQPELVGDGLEDFFDTDILVITLPFRRSLSDPRFYFQQVLAILEHISSSDRLQHIIFTSSTSVYPDDCGLAYEELQLSGHHDRARTLLAVEDLIAHQSRRFHVLRLAGLYGGQRRIGQFLSAKKNLSGGLRPVNLVHLDDVVSILHALITNTDIISGIYNVVADEHPTRQALYQQAAAHLGLARPDFKNEDPTDFPKVVDNRKIKKHLHYTFQHPDPMADVLDMQQ